MKDFSPFGTDLFGEIIRPAQGPLADRFTLPPFTVLDARSGVWQDRKRAWLSLGIKSEVGRGGELTWRIGMDVNSKENYDYGKGSLGNGEAKTFNSQNLLNNIMKQKTDRLSPGGSPMPSTSYSKDKARGDGTGKPLTAIPGGGTGKSSAYMFKQEDGSYLSNAENPDAEFGSGTSIFDPVICELAYRWFCPNGGHVLDPFAGGSIRGIAASKLGLKYTGIDISERQIEANRVQAKDICTDTEHPVWIVGDSRDIRSHTGGGQYDFIFSCPPYADLEVYSDDPRDISTLNYPEFRPAYDLIIKETCSLLANDRFACFVVGDVRDKKGFYYGFPYHTIEAFEKAGMKLYNEAVLLTAIGSLPVRVGKQFEVGRKLGKSHQNILIFCKGDPRKATSILNEREKIDV